MGGNPGHGVLGWPAPVKSLDDGGESDDDLVAPAPSLSHVYSSRFIKCNLYIAQQSYQGLLPKSINYYKIKEQQHIP
jgi:hypothetical protein